MPDQNNIDIDELQKAVNTTAEAYNRGYGSQQDYLDALKDAEKGVKGYSAAMRASMAQLGTSMKALGSAMVKGEEGASIYNQGLTSAADAVDKFASQFGFLGKLLGGLISAGAKYVAAVNKQADELFKSYNDISRIGATGADGMQGIFDNLQQFGYKMGEIGNMGELVKANATTLAQLGGTVSQGTKEFAKLSTTVRQSDIGYQLKTMGMTVDDMNAGMAGYLHNQAMTGQAQRLNADQLAKGAQEYLMQQDKLTKLTGLSADAQQKLQDDALTEQRYAATIFELQQKAAQGDTGAANKLKQYDAIEKELSTVPGNYRKAMLKAVSGFTNDEDVQQFRRSIGEDAYQKLLSSTVDQTDFMKTAGQGVAKTLQQGSTLAKSGNYEQVYGSFSGGMILASKAMQTNIDQRDKLAKNEQKVDDASTEHMVDLTTAQRNTTMALDKMTNIGINPVTKGMSALAKTINKVAQVPGEVVEAAKPEGTAPVSSGGGTAAPTSGGKKGPTTSGVAGVTAGSVQDKIIMAESGGRNIANQSGKNGAATSSAFGVAQLTKGTFDDLAKRAKAGSALQGKTFEDMKSDVNLQVAALNELLDYDKAALQKAGVQPTDANVYLAHFLGAGGAIRALTSDPNAAISTVISKKQWEANSQLQSMKTVADLRAWAENKMAGTKPSAANGGVLSGPKSGFQATLHGTEAVVPLPNGKSIPVDMGSNDQDQMEQINMLSTQLEKLDTVVRAMQRQNDIATKILKAHA